jgi:hypothetical protein
MARVGGPRKDTVDHGKGVFWGGVAGVGARGFYHEDAKDATVFWGWRASFEPRNTRNSRKGRGDRERWWLVVGR